MKEPNRERKTDIKYQLQLNDEQKLAKKLIVENQIVIITGRAGCGKSLVSAQAALDFLFKKQIDVIYVTRATIEVGNSLGFLPGGLTEKFNPYLEAFMENLTKCYDKVKITQLIQDQKVQAYPVQFIRGKTIDDILIVEEAQNLTKAQMLAILTRLGKTGKIIINGDLEQTDIRDNGINGLKYVIEMSKKLKGIEYIKLKENHRSDLVGAILDYEYNI
jgi:phosphate starvation-inducible PhoH-like protein